jgi:translocator protein
MSSFVKILILSIVKKKRMEMYKEKHKILTFFIWYTPVALVQMISGHTTVTSITPWYKALEKASWTPPDFVFGPVWTILYFMMTLAVWMVYQARATKHQHNLAYILFFTQLFANGLWSFLFFGFHLTGWALVNLVALIFLITATSICFFRIRPLAGLLLLPYLLWCMYALSLNAAIWWLN